MSNEKKHINFGKKVAGCVVGAVLTGTCVMGVCGHNMEAHACEADTLADTTTTQTCNAMYRLYNPYTGEHFYTADKAEKAKCISAGWRDEGIGWYAPLSSNTPVYRLYNKYAPGGDHHYTFNKSEYDCLIKKGWSGEGVGWYSDDEKQVMLYRQYNPFAQTGTHNYTTSKSENDNLDKVGWNAEGTAWYGVEHESHTWVTVNHPAVTHEEEVEEKVWYEPGNYCTKHKVMLMTREEQPDGWLGLCPAENGCLASCTGVGYHEKYHIEKVKKTVIDQEAYSETYCSDCGATK